MGNPDDYAVGDGKHAFRLDSVRAGCWFNPNNHDESAPHMSCTLPLPKTDPPITDLNTGLVEPANSVVIDAEHARKAVNVAGGMLAGPVLPAGSTLTVGALECTAVSGTSLSCRGPAGSFVFDGDRAAVEVTDLGVPAATKQPTAPTPAALGAGHACGEVRAAGSGRALPIVILLGHVDCAAALTMADRYVNDPTVVKRGSGQFADVDGWTCMWPYLPERTHAGSYLQCDDDAVNPQNSFRIGA
ncbi:hypothetical protein [Rhodococcus sp. PvR099]|uniref:hypothetical protein n=1 Tax=Rhodococcus sp. PvR099 TaxID=2806602 RepID=UPI001B6BE81F|nr:hypothetical protein [Rhodococcus sp. PvR099]MBP1159798.1 hypothetical protein [Rhodococcus sp. PvR099]